MHWRNAFVFTLIGVLSACGFQLRGSYDLPEIIKQVRVESSDPYGDLTQAVQKSLKKQGATVVSGETDAATLRLTNERLDRRVLRVDSDIEAKEYELKYQVTFGLTDVQGQVVVPNQVIYAVRDYELDATQESTRGSREQRLKRQMQNDLLQQMMRRIQAQAK